VILLTAAWHARSARLLHDRYGAEDFVPDGIEIHAVEGAPEEQLAYFIRPHRALVVAEIFAGDGHGGLALVQSPAFTDRAALDRSLRALLELPVERVLVSHGEPVLDGGLDAIRSALGPGSDR
jgi:glyoxylase-like metal-dependent hydrolase (beta-lactamase superfamily II)